MPSMAYQGITLELYWNYPGITLLCVGYYLPLRRWRSLLLSVRVTAFSKGELYEPYMLPATRGKQTSACKVIPK